MWPYVIVGSAIGGAVSYLFMTESGRKIRRAATRPDELTDTIEGARTFMERKARVVTDGVHKIINRAKRGIEEGQRSYQEAGERYRFRARQVESKNDKIASSVHNTVDKMSRTAVTVEHSVLGPICEMGALYRGIERGIRALFS
jgi:gas vesicle protein